VGWGGGGGGGVGFFGGGLFCGVLWGWGRTERPAREHLYVSLEMNKGDSGFRAEFANRDARHVR